MIDVRTGKNLKEYPILEDDRIYIYVMLNSVGKIKIGKTSNIQQRYQSLSGSNSQGNAIVKVCCSPATYLYTLETDLHRCFSKYRIENTEWFYDEKCELTFDIVVDKLKQLICSKEYKVCNEARRMYYERIKRNK